jgi:beta-galactosidase
MYIGVDYYPEHWPRDRWETDAALMEEAGFNVVRLAEFAWVLLEPEEGRFTFDWLDDALAILARHGIQAILGTPTAAMPAWVARKYPEVLQQYEDGRRSVWGARKQNCFSSGTYRLLSERITRAMATHYAATPNVIGWQTDNEFGWGACYCASCLSSFQDWLRARYETLEALNAAWGTHFWGHHLQAWGEITISRKQGGYNPGALLDWRRFFSWQNVRFQHEQVVILRQQCPQHFITHNFMGTCSDLNYYHLADELDFVSFDNYPVGTPWYNHPPEVRVSAAAAADVMRGLKRKNYWIMEQTAGPGGSEIMGRNPRPGEIRSIALQQVAHGADGMVWFRWRTCTVGAEQYWHGLLGHDGLPLRRYQEAATTAHDLRQLAPALVGTTVHADVAMIYDYDSIWALQIQPAFDGNDFHRDWLRYYRALFTAGVNVDMVAPTADFSSYKVVIAPELYVLPDAVADALAAFVQHGGVLVADIRLGVKDEYSRCHARTLPGRLRDVLGISIPEYEALPEQMEYAMAGTLLPGAYTAINFIDWVTVESAETLAEYRPWHMRAFAAATRHQYGSGWGYYVGCVVKEDAFYDALIAEVLQKANVIPLVTPPPGIELSVRRRDDGASVLFLLNHTEEAQQVTVPAGMHDLLGGGLANGQLTLAPFGVAVLQAQDGLIPTVV